MNYQKVHDEIITRARHRVETPDGEYHHVVPLSLGGINNKSNLVRLTYREHFIVHWLLTKLTTGKDKAKMQTALHCLVNKMSPKSKRIVSSWQFEIARRENRKSQQGKNNPMYGKKGLLAPAFGKRGPLCPLYGRKGARSSASRAIIERYSQKRYPSITAAAEELKLSRKLVVDVCKGRKLHTKGYRFSYIEED